MVVLLPFLHKTNKEVTSRYVPLWVSPIISKIAPKESKIEAHAAWEPAVSKSEPLNRNQWLARNKFAFCLPIHSSGGENRDTPLCGTRWKVSQKQRHPICVCVCVGIMVVVGKHVAFLLIVV